MAVDEKLICRLCVEVKEFCANGLGRMELQQLIEINRVIFTNNRK